MGRPDFRPSIDAKMLAERLAKVASGESVSYADLKAIIGRTVQTGSGHGALSTARKMVRESHRAVFRPIRAEGLRRLPDDEVTVIVPAEMRQRVRRKAARSIKELVTVDYEKLTPAAKTAHNVGLSMAGALTVATSAPTVKRLTEACDRSAAELPVGKTLELFGK